MSQEAVIFDIQRYCVHDGPGIRTTVFLKGCSLRCFWCHNPESISPKPELLFYAHKCIGCGRCFSACPLGCHAAEGEAHAIDRARCTGCGACAKTCYAGALVLSGKRRGAEDVMKTVRADAAFYSGSGGGLTCSGGEPLLQAGFVSALFARARAEGVHTALDTAGNVPYSAFEGVLPHTSLVLFDFKAADPELHRRGTGADNARALENLRRIANDGAAPPVWVRVPVVTGFNDTRENMEATRDALEGCPRVERLELLPYHSLGASKYASLGRPYEHTHLKAPSKAAMGELAALFKGARYEVVNRAE